MRMFCGNCVFVNMFASFFSAVEPWPIRCFRRRTCAYTTSTETLMLFVSDLRYGVRQPCEKSETSRPHLVHFNDYLFDELAKWTVYATSVPLIMVRFSVYRASKSLSLPAVAHKINWAAAILLSGKVFPLDVGKFTGFQTLYPAFLYFSLAPITCPQWTFTSAPFSL